MIPPAIIAIEAMVSPAVLITTSAVVGAGLSRLAADVNDRMREMTSERFSLRADQEGPLTRERIAEIDTQLGWLLERHRLLSRAVLFSYAAPLVLVLSVIVIAVAVATHSVGVGVVAAVLVAGGAAVLLVGLWYAVRANANSSSAIEYEVQRVRSL
jgi:Flp pilus assembly protein TadB